MSEKETSFGDIYGYITNSFSKDKMLEVENSIKENGEAEDVFHTMVFDYVQEKEYVDSLVGEDPEKNEDFFEKNRPKSENRTLYGKDKLKNDIMETKNGINLPKNFEEIKNSVEKLEPVIGQMITDGGRENYAGYAVDKIMQHCDKPADTAKEIVDDILAGIAEFDSQYESLKEQDTVDVSSLLGDRSDAEKKNIVINSLIAIEALKSESFSDEDIERLYTEYDRLGLDDLISKFENVLAENDFAKEVIEGLASEAGLTQEIVDKFKKMAENNTPENKKLQKFYTALALYLANYDKEIDLSVDGNGVEAKTIGACAAAAVELSAATADLNAGNIDLPTWAKWVKYIFAGLFIAAFVVATGIMVSFAGLGLLLVLMAMFGQGVLSTIIAFAIAIPVVKILIDKTLDLGAWLYGKLEGPYGKAIWKLVEVMGFVASFVKEKTDALWKRINRKEERARSAASSASEPATEQDKGKEKEQAANENAYEKPAENSSSVSSHPDRQNNETEDNSGVLNLAY